MDNKIIEMGKEVIENKGNLKQLIRNDIISYTSKILSLEVSKEHCNRAIMSDVCNNINESFNKSNGIESLQTLRDFQSQNLIKMLKLEAEYFEFISKQL